MTRQMGNHSNERCFLPSDSDFEASSHLVFGSDYQWQQCVMFSERSENIWAVCRFVKPLWIPELFLGQRFLTEYSFPITLNLSHSHSELLLHGSKKHRKCWKYLPFRNAAFNGWTVFFVGCLTGAILLYSIDSLVLVFAHMFRRV